jgi:hypothetical protein
MTSPISYLLPVPQEGARGQRDDDFFSPPSRVATPRTARENPMENPYALEQLRTRDGLPSAPFVPQVPQRRLVLPDPLALR